MDSLTQMVLGAACGEAVLGKKIGNRAMIWGAFAGTLPDLDIIGNFFLNPLDSLVFHRGPMHSLTFAVVMPFLLSWLVMKFYRSKLFNNKTYRWCAYGFGILMYLFMATAISVLTIYSAGKIGYIMPFVLFGFGIYLFKSAFQRYVKEESFFLNASYFDWVILFFVAIVTHPLLDSFTTFGTQLFWPFSSYRISCSNISILDPLYTLPFIFCVFLSSFYSRFDQRRSLINWIGIGISSSYMLFTIFNKDRVDSVFKEGLLSQGIKYEQFLSTPTILNNFLWYGIAKSDTSYYYAYYSILDKDAKIQKFDSVMSNSTFQKPLINAKNFNTLRWFSNDFYNVIPNNGDTIQYNDLRYGSFSFAFNDASDYIFHFKILNKNDEIKMISDDRPRSQSKNEIKHFWKRVGGI